MDQPPLDEMDLRAMANSQLPILQGKQITLRRPIVGDIEDRFSCGRHAEIVRMYGGDTRSLPS